MCYEALLEIFQNTLNIKSLFLNYWTQPIPIDITNIYRVKTLKRIVFIFLFIKKIVNVVFYLYLSQL